MPLPSWLSWPSLLRTLVSQARLTWRLLREPRVPLLTKSVPVLAAAYVISPLDFIPDVLPLIGEIDDVAVILIAIGVFIKLCPSGAVDFHRSAIAGRRTYSPMPAEAEVIDAEFHREEDAR